MLEKSEKARQLLAAAHEAWMNGGALRARRKRYKNYTYGNQWCDTVRDGQGRMVTERQMLEESGRTPMSNNLIRQLVKNIVGRYRYNAIESKRYEKREADGYTKENSLDELDSRMLEEYLISGCAIQRVGRRNGDVSIDNVSVKDFFINKFRDPRGRDVELVGMLHEMSLPEVLMRFAGNDRDKAQALKELYSQLNQEGGLRLLGESDEDTDWFYVASRGRCRVIEVWSLDCEEMLYCHDREKCEGYVLKGSELGRIQEENVRREKSGEAKIETKWEIDVRWHVRYFAPTGDVISEGDSPYGHKEHPFAVKFYPLTDGEVHPFVEDIIDQQKYINRLIVMIDHIMAHSAKGVLLFPMNEKPEGFSWREIAKRWASCNGIIPIKGTGSQLPTQMVTGNASNGAYQLLEMEMKLFEDVSGVSDALLGKNVNASTGSVMYENQVRNAAIALTDIYESFGMFTTERDRKAQRV
jgi:hypothetical protein